MEAVKIVLLCVVAAIGYGIAHDQVTARVCVEYFTIAHPRVIASEDPTLLALAWGVLATWWVGLGLGVLLAVAARAGSRPKLAAGDLARPVGGLLACMASVATGAAIFGWSIAPSFIPPPSIPPAARGGFAVAAAAHSASYLSGFAGGALLCLLTWRRRGKLARLARLAGDEAVLATERERLAASDRAAAARLRGAAYGLALLGLLGAVLIGSPVLACPCAAFAVAPVVLAALLEHRA